MTRLGIVGVWLLCAGSALAGDTWQDTFVPVDTNAPDTWDTALIPPDTAADTDTDTDTDSDNPADTDSQPEDTAPADTDDTDLVDTWFPVYAPSYGAAALAGEEGGASCEGGGCASAAPGASGAMVLLTLVGLRSRRRR